MKPSQTYKYDTTENKWMSAQSRTSSIASPASLKILTFNVLFDEWWGKPYKTHVVRSSERYAHQFKVMEQLDCDLICLNEVTANYVSKIIEEKWVQQNYYISDISGETINNFGNLLLSKFPISELYLVSLTKLKRPVVCARIPFEERNWLVAAAHLSAGGGNYERRQIQIKELVALLDKHCGGEEKLILGDINFHSEQEIVPETYTDSWKAIHPDLPGFTFDGTINPMLHEMWPLGWIYGFKDNIQMRLDRVFCKMQDWKPAAIEICLNEPVYEAKFRANLIKDFLSVAFDKLGVNIARNPKYYLFPSDHFGLLTTFVRNQ